MLPVDEISVGVIDDDIINAEWLRERGVVVNAEEPEESEKCFDEEAVLDQAHRLTKEFLARIEQDISTCPEVRRSGAYSRFLDILSNALWFTLDPATLEKLEEFRRILSDAEAAWEDAKMEFAPRRDKTPETWERDGYFALESKVLQENIVVVRNESCIAALPPEYAGWPVYTADEVLELWNKGITGEELQRYHAEKKALRSEKSVSGGETVKDTYIQKPFFPDCEKPGLGEKPELLCLAGVKFDPPPRPWQDWLDAVQVMVISDLNSWKRAVCEAKEAGVCGLDTETTGLDPHLNRLRLVQLAVPVFSNSVPENQRHLVKADRKAKTPGKDEWKYPAEGASAVSYVLDLFDLEEKEGPEAVKEAVQLLEELVAGEEAVKIFHNAAFDLSFLRAAVGHRIKVSRLFDTMLASQLCTAGDFIPESQFPRWCEENGVTVTKSRTGKVLYLDRHGHELKFERDTQKKIRPVYPTHSLQQAAHRHLEVWLEKDDLQDSDWSARELSEEQLIYAGRDAAVLLPLREILLQLLARNRLLEVAQIEFDCIPAVVEIELSGMPFDADRARKIKDDASARCEELRKRLAEIARESGFKAVPKKSKKKRAGLPCDLNPDSSVDVVECLRVLGEREGILDGGRFVVGGEEFPIESMDETLARLSSRLPDGSPMREFIENLREYRSAKKTYDFTKKWLELLHPKTGRLHADLRQINPQGVGRFSASNPNLQQCYDEETEILTESGWKRFRELRQGEKVAQFDPESGNVSFTTPEAYIVREYEGEMIHITHKHIDLLVTPDHRCLVIYRKTGKYYVREAKKFPKDGLILHGGEYDFGKKEVPKPFITLLCATQADGSWHNGGINFIFRKKRKLERLLQALKELGVPYSFQTLKGYPNTWKVRVLKSSIVDQMYHFLGSEKKFGPWLLKWTRQSAEAFLEEVFFWDGWWAQKSCYSTRVKENADWVQIVAILLGKRAKTGIYDWVAKHYGYSLNYRVYVTNRNYSHVAYSQVVNEPYKGKVYCVTVPTGFVIVRRNGNPVVCGNCPRGSEIRALFHASESRKLVVADYSNIEMRIMAELSKDRNLLEAFRRGADVHRLTAAAVSGKLEGDVTKEERQAAKSVNFGSIYGMQAPTLRLYAETSYGVKLTLEEAEAAREAFFRTYPGIAAWHARQDRRGFESGFQSYWFHDYDRGIYEEKRPCARTLGNRLRVWPVVKQKRRNGDGIYYRKAGSFTELYNSPDQGSGADMIKLAMAALYQELLARGWDDVSLIGCVHDELILDAPEKKAKDAASLLQETMVRAGEKLLPNVPVEVETGICDSWAEK